MHSKTAFQPFGALVTGLVMLLGLLFAGSTLAADCKGLSKSQCERNDACSWVQGYTTRKGYQVSAYCRAKPGKKNSSHRPSTTSKPTKKPAAGESSARTSRRSTAASTDRVKKDKKAKKDKKDRKRKKQQRDRKPKKDTQSPS